MKSREQPIKTYFMCKHGWHDKCHRDRCTCMCHMTFFPVEWQKAYRK